MFYYKKLLFVLLVPTAIYSVDRYKWNKIKWDIIKKMPKYLQPILMNYNYMIKLIFKQFILAHYTSIVGIIILYYDTNHYQHSIFKIRKNFLPVQMKLGQVIVVITRYLLTFVSQGFFPVILFRRSFTFFDKQFNFYYL